MIFLITTRQLQWFTFAHIVWLALLAAMLVAGLKMPRLIKRSIQDAKTNRDGRSHEREEYP